MRWLTMIMMMESVMAASATASLSGKEGKFDGRLLPLLLRPI